MRILAFVLSICISIGIGSIGVAQAQGEFYAFETDAQERLYNKLSKELRCPKCQNQSISDSDAPLAEDMRKKVHEMVLEGASYNDVVGFMKDRYGDFVHYQPPMNASTIVLWIGPLLVILIGLLFIIVQVRTQKKGEVELSEEEEAQLAAALNERSQKGNK